MIITKSVRVLIAITALVLAFAASPVVAAFPNLLADPSFESGTPSLTGIGGWSLFQGPTFSSDYARSGSLSLKEVFDPTAPGSQPYSTTIQKVPATAGATCTFSAYGLIQNYDFSSSSFGVLFLIFEDNSGNWTGTLVDSPDKIDRTSPWDTWIPISVTATAPLNTAFVTTHLVFWLPSANDVLYWDDATLTVVPEPSSLVLLGIGGIWLRARYRR